MIQYVADKENVIYMRKAERACIPTSTAIRADYALGIYHNEILMAGQRGKTGTICLLKSITAMPVKV